MSDKFGAALRDLTRLRTPREVDALTRAVADKCFSEGDASMGVAAAVTERRLVLELVPDQREAVVIDRLPGGVQATISWPMVLRMLQGQWVRPGERVTHVAVGAMGVTIVVETV